MSPRCALLLGLSLVGMGNLQAQIPVTTPGFLNQPMPGVTPGTLLSHPADNDSLTLGRTVTINYVNGWLIVGAESPGSAPDSDLIKRVYDISNPANPVRRLPSHFGLTYPNNLWIQNTDGWNGHGSAQSGPYLRPLVMRVQTFGGPVELGGQSGIPNLTEMPLGYNRSSQAGPWDATMLWYGTSSQPMQIQRVALDAGGVAAFHHLATFDHVGSFGGGDWHPIFFGDLLVYARSGAAANDGVVVYRLQYQDPDEDGTVDAVTPSYVGSLQGGFEGYWPNLFSDGTGLYVIGSATDILTSADITDAAHPAGQGSVTQGPTLTTPGFSNASYPVYQDHFGFIHNRKINMTQFLGGQGESSIALTLDEIGTGVDTTQISLPLGNLWITGGYPNANLAQGMGVWLHQSESDTTAPAVSYHIPQANRSHYPRHAPLSFLLHEHPRHGGMRNGIDFTVRPVLPGGTLGPAVEGFLIHDFSGMLTFTPSTALASATTYQVDFHSDPALQIGFADAAGNYIEPYSFRFSTGDSVNATTPPVFSALTASNYHPEPGQVFTITATAALGTGDAPLSYRFQLGDSWTEWDDDNFISHAFLTPGRHRILAQVRDNSGNIITRPLNLLVISPSTGPAPTQSSTLAIGDDPAGRRLWVVNPDANTVAVIDPTDHSSTEHAVGLSPRSIARDALGRYWVTCMGSDEIRVLNPDGSTHLTLPLAYGAAPFTVAPSPDGQSLFVTLYGSGHLLRYNALAPATPPVTQATFPTPRAIAVSGDGSRVFVTRFISPELAGEVGEFSGSTLSPVRTLTLAAASSVDNGDRAAGVPNYLSGIALSPDGTHAAIVSKQDNTQRGELFGVSDLTFETTVRAVISFVDLTTHSEIRHSRRDFDNGDSPSAVTYSPLGDTLFVTLQGNNRVVGLDAFHLAPITGPNANGATLTSPVIKTHEADTGLAPQGLLIDPVSQRFYIQNFMGRSVTVLDGQPFLSQNRTSLHFIATTATVGTELLAPDVLRGKRLFYNAADARMSAESYISCATCHIDGGHDGRVWDFTGRGEGLRRTTDLRGRSGTGHGNVHWTANFDEIQDFEHDIRSAFGGLGFLNLNPTEFSNQHPSPASTKTGASEDLDALAAYVTSLGAEFIPRSPHRHADGSLTASAISGRNHFVSLNCVSCHSGDAFTNSANTPVATPLLSAVGTTSLLSGERLNQPLSGIDTPSLFGLHASRTFLHHGQASDLTAVFNYTGGTLYPASSASLLFPPLVGDPLPPAPVFIETDNPAQGGGGFVRGALGGSFAHVTGQNGNGLRFTGIDGGSGGAARLTLRHIARGNGSTRIRVNDVEQSINLLPQLPNNDWMVSGWRTLTVAIHLNAGQDNVIEILRSADPFADFQLNSLLVSTADDIAAAQAHRILHDQPLSTRNDLLAYLRQLDGSSQAPPDNPIVTITLSPGQLDASPRPYAEFDVVFSRPIQGLTADDFESYGTAGSSARHLLTVSEGTHYRLRVAGFSQPGTVTLRLPDQAVTALNNGQTNFESNLAQLTYAPPVIDDLSILSDEFEAAETLGNWQRNYLVEGWGPSANKFETWDINTSRPGHMRVMPVSSTWYNHNTAGLAFKTVTGNFVATIRLDAQRRHGLPGRPQSDYTWAGLMVRAPRALTNAAPFPDPGSATVLPWPPDGSYTTPWNFQPENYLYLASGFGTNATSSDPNLWQFESKITTDSNSDFYSGVTGIPAGQNLSTLQIARIGQTFLLLRRHGQGAWILQERYTTPNLPATVQVGVTAYTNYFHIASQDPFHHNRTAAQGGNPDIVADFDYFHLRRPDPSLTEADLLSPTVTGPSGPATALSTIGLSTLLGDTADTPHVEPTETYDDWLAANLTASQLVLPSLTDPQGDANADGLSNLLEFVLGGNAAQPLSLQTIGTPQAPQVRLTHLRNAKARGVNLIVEACNNLIDWQPIATSVNGAPPTGTASLSETLGDLRTVTLEIPFTEPGFFRLRAERIPNLP
jgi:DNA-binding beta-propeller fold protein YncE